MKITLETDYKTTGNSSERQIDTLAIALTGDDYNDLEEYNVDWLWDVEKNAREYWLDSEAETFFQKALTKKQAEAYAEDLDAYLQALDEYKSEHFNEVRDGDWPIADDEAQKACADAMEEALSEAQRDLYHDWLYGDYRGNFDGILPQADKRYRDYGITFNYDEKTDTLSIELDDDTIMLMYEAGAIDRKTQEAVLEYITNDLNAEARGRYRSKLAEIEKRRAENERVREYTKAQAEETEQAKRDELKKLAQAKID